MGTYLNVLKPEDTARKEIPLSEVLPAPAGGVDTGKKPPEPPLGIGHYRKFGWAKEIKAITIIPDFVVPTAEAREVLPAVYTREDVVGGIACTNFSFYSSYVNCEANQIKSNKSLGLQLATCCPAPRGSGKLSSRPRYHLLGHAG